MTRVMWSQSLRSSCFKKPSVVAAEGLESEVFSSRGQANNRNGPPLKIPRSPLRIPDAL